MDRIFARLPLGTGRGVQPVPAEGSSANMSDRQADGDGSRLTGLANVTRHCLEHTLSELAPNGVHSVLPTSSSQKVKAFCGDLFDLVRGASSPGTPVRKRAGTALSLPATSLLTELEIHKFFEGAVSVLEFVEQIEKRLVEMLPRNFNPEELHCVCWRYYETEKKNAVAYPKWLSSTCTYRLWLVFNCVLGQSVRLRVSADTMNEVLRRMVELCGYSWSKSYEFHKLMDVNFVQYVEAITDLFDTLGLDSSLTCEVIADMVDEIVHGVLRKGYLTKKGHKRKNWRRRWFILQRTTLRYFESREKLTLKVRATQHCSLSERVAPCIPCSACVCVYVHGSCCSQAWGDGA